VMLLHNRRVFVKIAGTIPTQWELTEVGAQEAKEAEEDESDDDSDSSPLARTRAAPRRGRSQAKKNEPEPKPKIAGRSNLKSTKLIEEALAKPTSPDNWQSLSRAIIEELGFGLAYDELKRQINLVSAAHGWFLSSAQIENGVNKSLELLEEAGFCMIGEGDVIEETVLPPDEDDPDDALILFPFELVKP